MTSRADQAKDEADRRDRHGSTADPARVETPTTWSREARRDLLMLVLAARRARAGGRPR